MKKASCWNLAARVVAVLLIFTLWGPLTPTSVFTQSIPPLNCAVNGMCFATGEGVESGLMGLPQGTLRVATYDEWDRLVRGRAAGAWLPVELEARATLAALHGVANDNRLTHFAYNELRATMFLRLLAMIQRKAEGAVPLSDAEQDALDMLGELVAERRIAATTKAIAEYDRWASNPCGYQPPAGFGFEAYVPGPKCQLGGVNLAGPPSPPSAKHFIAYGKALASVEFTSTAATTAWDNVDREAAFFVILSSAILLSTVAAVIGLFALPAAVGAMIPVAAVLSTYATFASGFFAAGASAIGSLVGAIAVPTMIVAATVVFILGTIQFFEDASVRPDLVEALQEASKPPDLKKMLDEGSWELKETFLAQTWKQFSDPTLNATSDALREASTAVPAAPSTRVAGDPVFQINGGPLVDSFTFRNDRSVTQQAFVSQGWFVTREMIPGTATWGPWKWRLTLRYASGNLSSLSSRSVKIQPDAFLDSGANDVGRKSTITTLDALFQTQTVTLAGNLMPRLSPTVSERPAIGTPVTFRSNVSDPNGDTIRRVRWFLDDGTVTPVLNKASLAECTLNPPNHIDPVSQLPDVCPWTQLDEVNGAVAFTYNTPGTFTAKVMAEDQWLGISSESFTVSINDVAPTLIVASPTSAAITEGQSLTVTGSLDYAGFANGVWGDLVELVIDWGDGGITRYAYPCNGAQVFPGTPSDATCGLAVGGGYAGIPPLPNLASPPWPWSFTHTLAYGPLRTLSGRDIKIYAHTSSGVTTPIARIPVTVTNIPPVFTAAYTCGLPGIITPGNPVLCIGGDLRQVAVGASLSIRAKIADVPGASHLIKVNWGDNTSSAYLTALGEASCGTDCPWLNEPPIPTGVMYHKLTHTYDVPGVYPIAITIDDGGTNGEVMYTSEAKVFGITAPVGATEVNAGEVIPYTFTSADVDGASPAPVALSCEGGTVGNVTASSFTCLFTDVGAETLRKVKVEAIIGGSPFERALDVKVKVRPTTISPLEGPTTVTAGTEHTYTYTESHSTVGGFAFFIPFCGDHATLTRSVGGSSITCRFGNVSQSSTSVLGIEIAAPGGTATSSLDVTVLPDVEPPVLSLPGDLVADSTSNDGSVVSFTATATDAVSGPAAVSCTPQSGAHFPIGTTAVFCAAADWVANAAIDTFTVTVVDRTAPTLSLPPPIAVDATGPSGAVVTYEAVATDAPQPAPSLACSPVSGSTFQIGTTSVACVAMDGVGNQALGEFDIKVRGAGEQIATLRAYVQAQTMDAAVKRRLLSAINNAANAINAGRSSACQQLASIASVVESSVKKLTPSQVERLLTDVARIRAVQGCG